MNPREPLGPPLPGEQAETPARHLVLVGLPGTGKSTVAPLLASVIRRDAADLDSVIEQQAGCAVAELFSSVGEAGFRDREIRALAEVLRRSPLVLATGGGVVTTPGARAALKGSCVVWLRARTDTLAQRLSTGGDPEATRPLLEGTGRLALSRRLEELSMERSDLYAEVADVVVDVDDRTPSEVARAIIDLLNENET